VCTGVICGDGLVVGDELCDDGNTIACDSCSADCRSTEGCGNGVVECNEECDRGTDNSMAPNAACRLDCHRQRCGDGIVDDLSGEDCDGAAPATESCQTLGFYEGTVGCSEACRVDTTTCEGFCGDGEVNGFELCDGAPLSGKTCLDYGYDIGNLYCSSLCTPSFSSCERMGFEPMTFDESVYLYAVWGTSPNDVFAVGLGGGIMHYDGTRWAAMDSGVSQPLWGLWGAASDDVYAVGDEGVVVHYNGATWSQVDLGTDIQLNYVWGTGPSDIFVCGREGLMFHFDGTAWTSMPTGLDVSIVNVWGSGANDVFACSSYGNVIHYDGTAWTDMTADLPLNPADAIYLYAIWGIGPNDVFVTGDLGIILHYDGAVWTQMDSGTGEFINAIYGTGPDNIYAGADGGVMAHFDGLRWSPINSGTTQAIYGLWTAGDDVFAVGPATIQHFSGGPTTEVIDLPHTTSNAAAIWGASASDLFVALSAGSVLHFDGLLWSDTGLVAPDGLWSLWGAASNDLYACGLTGGVFHYDGAAWTTMVSNTTGDLRSIWGSGPSDIFAVGDVILHFNGTSWAEAAFVPLDYLRGVWGSGPSDVYAVGDPSTILHYDGSLPISDPGAWVPMLSGIDSRIYGVWGAGVNDVYALADLDGVWHYDGIAWSKLSVNSKQSFDAANGTSSTDFFAVEYLGLGLFHYNGIDWAPLRVPAGKTYSVWAIPEIAYVGMDKGKILKVDRHLASRETRCSDRWDNDGDGLLNCSDSDCAQDPYCEAGGLCQTLNSLSCGAAVAGSTVGGSPFFERYGCAARIEQGREIVYRYAASATGNVTVTLTTASGNLDVIVVGTSMTGGCDPLGSCLAASAGAEPSKQVTFAATSGAAYYIIVDGVSDAMGTFNLTVSCE